LLGLGQQRFSVTVVRLCGLVTNPVPPATDGAGGSADHCALTNIVLIFQHRRRSKRDTGDVIIEILVQNFIDPFDKLAN
jgi:hypothetical protein